MAAIRRRRFSQGRHEQTMPKANEDEEEEEEEEGEEEED